MAVEQVSPYVTSAFDLYLSHVSEVAGTYINTNPGRGGILQQAAATVRDGGSGHNLKVKLLALGRIQEKMIVDAQ